MSLRRAEKLFAANPAFVRFRKAFSNARVSPPDNALLRSRALELAGELEPRRDRSELERALSRLEVSFDPGDFETISPMLAFIARTLFRDVSRPLSSVTRKRIFQFNGPTFFFVSHTSFYDYPLTANLLHRMGISAAVMHASGKICTGWLSRWLTGVPALKVSKSPSAIEHRAYSWFCAALAEKNMRQVLFARTSRYTVRARDGILREPYVPHGVISAVKASGKAMVVPVAISYSVVPEDRYLTASALFPTLSVLPKRLIYFAPFLMGLRKPEKLFRGIEGSFGDVSLDLGEPFVLTNDDSLTLQRISHRAIEEIARNKMIHPSHLVAGAMQEGEKCNVNTLREKVERQVDKTTSFFVTRYRTAPPFHPLIKSDLAEALARGVKDLVDRRALARSPFLRAYRPRDHSLLRFYGYHGDRRIYPLSGRNAMTVVNAGAWGYTLALHIGMNLLAKKELAEHSLVLYDSREDLIEKLTVEGRHPWHFKEIDLPRSVRPEADLRAAISDTSLVLLVTPSKYFHSALIRILEAAPNGSDLVIATKGFIPETGLLPCQTARQEMERAGKTMRLSVLSGANLAHEIVEGGAGVTQIACEEVETFERLRTLIETSTFRVVYSGDVIGTTIAAALKNVYAIGFGILEGSPQTPDNFLATYSTLVTAEIRQFGMLLGAQPETFDSESQVWLADLIATCRGGRSARYGRDLAAKDDKAGKSLAARALLDHYRKKRLAVEGFEASRYAQRMATQRGFHPPILGEIYAMLHSGKKVDIDKFVLKCLDALSHQSRFPLPSKIPYRPRAT
jgi:glycerol-3-phosphate dehydrogenase (NAD(P)+)